MALIIALTACGPAIPLPAVVNTTPTSTKNHGIESPVSTATYPPLPTFTPYPFIPVPFPTFYPTPLINKQVFESWLTQNAISTPIRMPIAQIEFNSPRVYIKDGNLYFQDSNGEAIQITDSGKDQYPILSDDGQKVVFYRGENYDNLYSINTDGSNEQLLVTSKSLPTLGQGEIKAPTFRPNTHYLLFNTYLCNPRPSGPSYNAPDCTVGIYGVNTDTGDLTQIIAGLSGNTSHERNFEVSPDGQYISVASLGHINIYRGSDMIYQNAIIYNITRPDEYLPRQFWLPDSSGLLAIVAINSGFPPESYAVYRYKLGEIAAQVSLNIPIVRTHGDTSCVSPDRNWILFAGKEGGQLSNVWTYLGNLNNGQTQAFDENGWYLYDCQWSPDSRHFVSTKNTINFIGSIDGALPVPVGGYFWGWIDNTHYYYLVTINGDSTSTKVYIGEITNN